MSEWSCREWSNLLVIASDALESTMGLLSWFFAPNLRMMVRIDQTAAIQKLRNNGRWSVFFVHNTMRTIAQTPAMALLTVRNVGIGR
jgi:hypothetical protein